MQEFLLKSQKNENNHGNQIFLLVFRTFIAVQRYITGHGQPICVYIETRGAWGSDTNHILAAQLLECKAGYKQDTHEMSTGCIEGCKQVCQWYPKWRLVHGGQPICVYIERKGHAIHGMCGIHHTCACVIDNQLCISCCRTRMAIGISRFNT